MAYLTSIAANNQHATVETLGHSIQHREIKLIKVYLKGTRPLSKAFFVQCKLYRKICLILLEKQFVEVWRQWIHLNAHRLLPVTFGNDHGNHIYVSECTPIFLFFLFWYCFTFLPLHVCVYFKGGINRKFITF